MYEYYYELEDRAEARGYNAYKYCYMKYYTKVELTLSSHNKLTGIEYTTIVEDRLSPNRNSHSYTSTEFYYLKEY